MHSTLFLQYRSILRWDHNGIMNATSRSSLAISEMMVHQSALSLSFIFRALLALAGLPGLVSFVISLLVLVIRSRTLLVLSFIFLALSLFLLLTVLDLVIDQIMKSCNGANQRADINRHKLVVGLDAHRTRKVSILELKRFCTADCGAGLGCREVGEEVEDVLEVAQDGMVDGKLSIENLL